MKKYIKPSMEIIEMNSDIAILAASGTPNTSLGTTEIEGPSSQSREMRSFSLWDGAEE